ncbi:TetR/AcrR family transcriptional regulator [Glycomyces paridis]|uniref:TetR/AcrR family transcriptional regulator n=1 Tax=Glycomyces paridis TaxID=2126555 RepID=A0A4S8PM15_9ACTN|nr:TetR/AcrR family transcriptional regulator [Glycomyces paridis]THV30785.1 TetR/AcrR family transcriptional regulator [Glycomyces paridis]
MNATAPRAERVDAQRNRRKVLETADRLFAERGTAVALGEIATAAGVGAGTVYRHFPTKEALMATVLDLRTEQLTARGLALREERGPGEAFFAFLRHVSEQAFANRGICEALASRGEWRRPLPTEGRCVVDSPLASLLLDAQRVGAVRPDLDVDDARAMMLGFVAMAQTLASPERAWRLMEVLLEGLRTDVDGTVADGTDADGMEMKRNSATRNEIPVGAEIRNETKRKCPVCGAAVPVSATGRPAKYCSSACRQKAFREQRKTAAPPAGSGPRPGKVGSR